MKKFKGLVLEGGGARGIVYSGALQAIEKKGLLKDIIHYVGTSVGSITALMLALDYTPKEITNKMIDLKSKNILKKDLFFYMREVAEWNGVWNTVKSLFYGLTIGLIRVPLNIYHLIFSYGYYDSSPLRKWLISLLEEKGFDKETSFTTIYEKTGKKLYITTTNWDERFVRVFSPDDEELSVLDAVMTSISIPYFFRPKLLNGVKYCDGGLTANYNINFLSDNNVIPAKDILGLRVDSKSEIDGRLEGKLFKSKRKKSGFIKSLENLIDIIYCGANAPNLKGSHEQVTIPLVDYGVGVVDFSLSKEQKQYYSDMGLMDFIKKYDQYKDKD